MAMDSFSWGDSIRATLGSCLPCIKSGHDSDNERDQNRNGARGARGVLSAREELERLLDEPMTDYDDVETMSLHSNVGGRGGKRSKKKSKTGPTKTVRVFGIDLFGRRPVSAANLEDDDDDEESWERRRPRTISTSTLDSDAAPLADDAITDFTTRAKARWAPAKTDEQLAAEEALERQRFEKEVQRERRRERKEMKRLGASSGTANAAAELDLESSEFEGFPGSGSGLPPSADEFGPFIGGSSSHVQTAAQPELIDSGMELRGDLSDDKEEDADFGATAYTKKRRLGDGGASGSGSGSHTRSRSRTSASISADGDKSRVQRSNAESTARGSPLPTQSENGSASTKGKSRSKSKSKSNKGSDKGESNRAKHSKSSVTSSSAVPSLPSPTLPPSPGVKIRADDFDGVPGGLSTPTDHLNPFSKSALPSPSLPSTGFPSTGFGSFKRSTSGLKSGAGVVLARRGDD